MAGELMGILTLRYADVEQAAQGKEGKMESWKVARHAQEENLRFRPWCRGTKSR
jgi:hypothetical protein